VPLPENSTRNPISDLFTATQAESTMHGTAILVETVLPCIVL
jgi:hypothetical protein